MQQRLIASYRPLLYPLPYLLRLQDEDRRDGEPIFVGHLVLPSPGGLFAMTISGETSNSCQAGGAAPGDASRVSGDHAP